MSYIWEYIKKNPQETKRLLGIDSEQLQQLIEQGKLLHQQRQAEIERKKIRLISAGGGNQLKLSLEDQIILTKRVSASELNFSSSRSDVSSK